MAQLASELYLLVHAWLQEDHYDTANASVGEVYPILMQVVARTRQLPLFLTDGWKADTAAFLQVVGVVYWPRLVGTWGVSRSPGSWRLKPCSMCRWSRAATRPGTSWRSVAGWWTVVLAVLSSRCALATRGDDSDGVSGTLV
jgi:hypothetical protein